MKINSPVNYNLTTSSRGLKYGIELFTTLKKDTTLTTHCGHIGADRKIQCNERAKGLEEQVAGGGWWG